MKKRHKIQVMKCVGIKRNGCVCAYKSAKDSYTCKKHKKQDRKPECSICHEEINKCDIHMTSCKHMFHKQCIETWKNETHGESCPNCRENIRMKHEKLIEYCNEATNYHMNVIEIYDIYYIYKTKIKELNEMASKIKSNINNGISFERPSKNQIETLEGCKNEINRIQNFLEKI